MGELVEEIRIAKGISIKELIDDNISRSFYYRFRKGDTDISLENFFELLSSLNVTFDEILMFVDFPDFAYLDECFTHKSSKLNQEFKEKSYDELVQLREDYFEHGRLDVYYDHIAWIIDMYIVIRFGVDYDERTIQQVKDYLKYTYQWFKHEMILFNQMYEFYTLDEIKVLLPRIHTYIRLNAEDVYLSYNLVFNLFIYALEFGNTMLAIELYDMLNINQVSEEAIIIRIQMIFMKEFVEELKLGYQVNDREKEIHSWIDVLSDLGYDTLAENFEYNYQIALKGMKSA